MTLYFNTACFCETAARGGDLLSDAASHVAFLQHPAAARVPASWCVQATNHLPLPTGHDQLACRGTLLP